MEDSGVFFLAILIIVVSAIVVFWRLFEKAGIPGYTAIIPIYNGYKLFDIAGKGSAFILVLIIQFVGGLIGGIIIASGQPAGAIINLIVLVIVSIITIQVYMKLSVCFGKNKWFGPGLFFIPFVFFPILAFDKSIYQKPVSNEQTIPISRDIAKQMYVDDLKSASEIIKKLNITRGTYASWNTNSNWEELRVNKHKDKLITHITGKITANPNDSSAAFKSIFMDLDVEPEFTDNEMMAGLKYIALYNENQKIQEFAKQIMKEGGKKIEDINIEIKGNNIQQ